MAIALETIPPVVRTPGSFGEANPQPATIPSRTFRLLLVGLSDEAIADDDLPDGPVQMITPEDGFTTFGNDSVVGHQVEAAFANDRNSEIWALGVKETAGAVATHTITWTTGPATGPGVYHFVIGNRDYRVAIADADDDATGAAATAAAVNADPRALVTALSALGVTTLTVKQKGEYGIDIGVRLDLKRTTKAPGFTTDPAIAAGVAGTWVDHTAAQVLTAMGSRQYNNIVWLLDDSAEIAEMEIELDKRFGGMEQKEGVLFIGIVGDSAALLSATTTRNSPFSVLVPNDSSDTPPWIAASIMAAINAQVASADPALQKTGLPAIGFRTPFAESTVYNDRDTRDTLLENGVSTWKIRNDGTVEAERVVTTSRERNGVADDTYFDINPVEIFGLLRAEWNSTIAFKHGRKKLGDENGQYDPGQPIVTVKTLKGDHLMLAQSWERRGLIENGTAQSFVDGLIFVRNDTDPNRVDGITPVNLMNQLRVVATRFDFTV